jgi:hypothetical protein
MIRPAVVRFDRRQHDFGRRQHDFGRRQHDSAGGSMIRPVLGRTRTRVRCRIGRPNQFAGRRVAVGITFGRRQPPYHRSPGRPAIRPSSPSLTLGPRGMTEVPRRPGDPATRTGVLRPAVPWRHRPGPPACGGLPMTSGAVI